MKEIIIECHYGQEDVEFDGDLYEVHILNEDKKIVQFYGDDGDNYSLVRGFIDGFNCANNYQYHIKSIKINDIEI